jgi:hypothetical protein
MLAPFLLPPTTALKIVAFSNAGQSAVSQSFRCTSRSRREIVTTVDKNGDRGTLGVLGVFLASDAANPAFARLAAAFPAAAGQEAALDGRRSERTVAGLARLPVL